MLHPSSNQAHQRPNRVKKSTASFPFSVPNVEEVGKNLKISYLMIDSSAVWKAIAVRFSLLDRARRAAHCANIGFSIPDYSPVLHWLKCPAQRWTRRDDTVLVLRPCEWCRTNGATWRLIYNKHRKGPTVVSLTQIHSILGLSHDTDIVPCYTNSRS
jgi:hypothetical protein